MTDPEFDRLMTLINGGMGFIAAHAQVEAERKNRMEAQFKEDLKGQKPKQPYADLAG